MRIIVSARRFTQPLLGGADVYADRLARAFDRQDHEVMILAIDTENHGSGEAVTISEGELNGLPVVRLHRKADGLEETHAAGYDPHMGRAIKEILNRLKPDLFIILNFYLLTLASVEAAKELGIPVVHIVTDFVPICRRATFVRGNGEPCLEGESVKNCTDCFVSQLAGGKLVSSLMNGLPEKRLIDLAGKWGLVKKPHPAAYLHTYWRNINLMEKRLQRLAPLRSAIDLVLPPTRFTYDIFCANGFSPEQLHLLPFAFEMKAPAEGERYKPADHIRFVFISRFQPYKGAHLLLEAFNSLTTPNGATLTFFGAPDGYDSYFKDLKARMDSSERVTFGGRLDPSELKRAFSEADYFILPSTWHENMPLILLDALESGTPVIASSVGGVTDLVQDGVNGFLYPMGDTDALKNILQKAIDQPELAGKLRTGINLPRIEDYAATLLHLIESRLGRRIGA